jgi:hypothetical protein
MDRGGSPNEPAAERRAFPGDGAPRWHSRERKAVTLALIIQTAAGTRMVRNLGPTLAVCRVVTLAIEGSDEDSATEAAPVDA